MKLPLLIARRYLFAPGKHNAINIISLVSVAGIAVGTAALVIILSVFNGIDLLLGDATASFIPDLTLSPATGKFAPVDTPLLARLNADADILHHQVVVEETAMIKLGQRTMPVTVKGVTPDYDTRVNLSATIIIGQFALEEKGEPAAILGAGIASALRVRLGVGQPVTLYYPDRHASPTSPSVLNSRKIYPVAIFSAQQELDDKYLVTSIDAARTLFDADGRFSKIEIALRDPSRTPIVKARLAADTPYRVQDKHDLNGAFYAMMRSEKLVIFLLLLFILGIASFNVIASISMLIIDKRDDIATLHALGATRKTLVATFRLEGLLTCATGMTAGLVAGLAISLLQQHFGLVSLGEGSYLVQDYPVKIDPADILLITATVAAIGAIASYFPPRHLIREQNPARR
jgi:lipoprotein-releasing system permease protein